ncbi:MAG TPA: cation:proton antiporter [Sphingomonas sp.]|nr:cation:proton antiporter [Sphingomonas sp.]
MTSIDRYTSSDRLVETGDIRVHAVPDALYIAILAGLGAVILITAWLPMMLRAMPLSLPILCVAGGALLFALPALRPFAVHPMFHPVATERLTELVVIVSLMGAGLKIDRPIGLRSWAPTWRLLGIAMPITIVAAALLAAGLLGLGLATALLMGAVLAPTDPVLASDIQVGAPGEGKEDDARFALTSEAGLNDGLAFPFVNLAIALALGGSTFGATQIGGWLLVGVFGKLLVGTVVGYAVGWGLGYATFRLPTRANLSRTGPGFVALGATFLAYGLTQVLGGYGFLAVFVSALAIRHASRDDLYHNRLHDFAEEVERLLMLLLLVLFGGMIAHAGLLAHVDWHVVLFTAGMILVARPLSAAISLAGSGIPWRERMVISFFGIRGMGSIYYLAFALNHAAFQDRASLWSVIAFVVLISILLHGVTAAPSLRLLDRWRRTHP